MHKYRLAACVTASIMALNSQAMARTLSEDDYILGENPYLSMQEETALNIARKWREGDNNSLNPSAGKDGTVIFIYGIDQPSVVCAITQVCDVALEPGETVQKEGLHIGDPARWSVMPSISGHGAKERTHLVIKPRGSIGNSTTLFVATDKRTYHIKLLSHREEYMPKVAFHYPDMENTAWNLYQDKAKKQEEKLILPETKENIAHLDFDYTIKGKTRWKPVRVYNNGTKTIIQLPANIHQTEIPTLLVINGSNQEQIVNYRLRDGRYIVDQVFDKAILIAGVGRKQEKITITKKNQAKDI